MEKRGWKITGGGGRGPEEYLPGPGGARRGSSYPDITATKDGKTLRVNTVDNRADGVTPITREVDFLFNRNIDQSNAYNALRAEGNASRIGIADTAANRTEVTRLFNEAYNNPATIIGSGKLPGSNVREFFLPGVTGTGSKIQFVEQGGNIITIMAK